MQPPFASYFSLTASSSLSPPTSKLSITFAVYILYRYGFSTLPQHTFCEHIQPQSPKFGELLCNSGNYRAIAYVLNSTKRFLARFSATDRGLEISKHKQSLILTPSCRLSKLTVVGMLPPSVSEKATGVYRRALSVALLTRLILSGSAPPRSLSPPRGLAPLHQCGADDRLLEVFGQSRFLATID